MSTTLAGSTALIEPVVLPRRGHRGRTLLAILRNRKATAGLLIFLLICLVAAFPHLFAPWFHGDAAAVGWTDANLQPSSAHWLGTTTQGQDVYVQIVYSARRSLLVALLTGAGASALSVLVGVSAAYLGGIADNILSLVTDVFLVLPAFPMIIVFATYSAGHGSTTVIVLVMIVTGWAFGARQMRAQALSVRNREFLEAARVRGERRSYIIFRELLPTMTSLIIAHFLAAALFAELTVAGIQFLGLGNNSDMAWGTMLYWAHSYQAIESGLLWWMVAPGLAIALLGVSFALMNYAFDEIGNPALRPVRRRRRGQRSHS